MNKLSPEQDADRIYILTEYEYDTYSYSEISEAKSYFFKTEAGARATAMEMGKAVVNYCQIPEREVTISQAPLRD